MKFTALALQSLRPRGERFVVTETGVSADRRGLQLVVEPSGSKRFVARFKIDGRSHKRALGTLGTGPDSIDVAEARRRLDEVRRHVRQGVQPPPMVERRHRPAPGRRRPSLRSRRDASRPYVALFERQPDGKLPPTPPPYSMELLAYEFFWKYCVPRRRRPEFVSRMLVADILPRFTGRDVRTVKPREIIEHLDAVAARAPVLANRVQSVLVQMFKFAIHRGLREDTPVVTLMPVGGEESSRERVLDDAELKKVWRQIKSMPATTGTKRALRVLALTGVRRGELGQARWEHIDLDKAEWLIPGSVHKNGKDFLTPLTPLAVSEFRKLKALAGRSPYVLPGRDAATCIDSKSITRAVARCQKHLGVKQWVVHDLRRTLRTGLGRLKVPGELAERCIGHLVGSRVERVYDRADYLEERRAALMKWEAHLVKVVS
jgi:integrase